MSHFGGKLSTVLYGSKDCKIMVYLPKSPGLMYKIPALDTVAGVAVLKLEISKINLISLVRAILSLLAKVSILLSSITVFRDSIHIGSISPSKIIHLGP